MPNRAAARTGAFAGVTTELAPQADAQGRRDVILTLEPLERRTIEIGAGYSTTEGAGGDNNLLSINLRNAYYDTVDYHDYLVPGMNVIVIGLQAAASSADYSIRAVAVGA